MFYVKLKSIRFPNKVGFIQRSIMLHSVTGQKVESFKTRTPRMTLRFREIVDAESGEMFQNSLDLAISFFIQVLMAETLGPLQIILQQLQVNLKRLEDESIVGLALVHLDCEICSDFALFLFI